MERQKIMDLYKTAAIQAYIKSHENYEDKKFRGIYLNITDILNLQETSPNDFMLIITDTILQRFGVLPSDITLSEDKFEGVAGYEAYIKFKVKNNRWYP